MMRNSGLAAFVLLVSACTGHIETISIDSHTQLAGQGPIDTANRCAFRLAEIRDARPTKERAGGTYAYELKVEEASVLVRDLLLKAGLLPMDVGDGEIVVVELKQLYLSQIGDSLIPTVVYEVSVAGGSPFVIRAQRAKMQWTGSKDETLSAFSSSLQQANSRLMATLATLACDRSGGAGR